MSAYRGWTYPWYDHSKAKEMLADLPNMISIFDSCKMHIRAPRDTLAEAMSHALDYVLVPLVLFILDAGLDKSTLLERPAPVFTTEDFPWLIGPICLPAKRRSQAPDHEACYNDTGRHSVQVTLVDYACFYTKMHLGLPLEAHKLIEFLLARGCLRPGDAGSHVRALKNWGAGLWIANICEQEII